MNAPSSSPSQHPGYPIVIGILAILSLALGALIIMNQNTAEKDKRLITELTNSVSNLQNQITQLQVTTTLATPPASVTTGTQATLSDTTQNLKWIPYNATFGAVHFQYPQGWYVLTSPRIQCGSEKESCIGIQSSPLDMILSGGIRCESGAPCTEEGLQIVLTRTAPGFVIPNSATTTTLHNILKDDLSQLCKNADGVCSSPLEQYYLQTPKDTYRISVRAVSFNGDLRKIIDDFLSGLTTTERASNLPTVQVGVPFSPAVGTTYAFSQGEPGELQGTPNATVTVTKILDKYRAQISATDLVTKKTQTVTLDIRNKTCSLLLDGGIELTKMNTENFELLLNLGC